MAVKDIVNCAFEHTPVDRVRVPFQQIFSTHVIVLVCGEKCIGDWLEPALLLQPLIRLPDLYILSTGQGTGLVGFFRQFVLHVKDHSEDALPR